MEMSQSGGNLRFCRGRDRTSVESSIVKTELLVSM